MDANTMVEVTGLILFFLGLIGLLIRESILKSILSLTILEIGVILYVLGINYRIDQQAPVITGNLTYAADPLPQALMITTIIIGVGITAITVTLLRIVEQRYGTTSWNALKELRKEDD